MTTPEALQQAAHDVRMRLRLTPRWTPLKDHAGQAQYYWSPVRFKINPSGRRSGKTELAKRKAVRYLTSWKGWPAKIIYGAPTFGQAKDIFWQDLKDLIPREWVAKVSETDLEITTLWGAKVRVFGFDRPRRIEGVIWDWLGIDEWADAPAGAFARNIRPALSTLGREGSADLIGVPDEVGRNQAEYEELWEIGLQWPHRDKDICSFHWPSWDIIDPAEVEAARANLDEISFTQEYGGRFTTSGGKALPRFDTAYHVSEKHATYCPGLPLDWSLDFGTRWVAHTIGQSYRGRAWIIDEIAIQDSSTDVAVDEFIGRARSSGWDLRRLRLFGDAAGHAAGSALGKSDYEVIEDKLRAYGVRNVEWRQIRFPAPPVKDSLNAVRARTCTANNVVHLHIHPRCTHLIDNCKKAPWPDGSNKLKDYHWLAALRYYCYELFGVGDVIGGVGPSLHPALGGQLAGRRPRS